MIALYKAVRAYMLTMMQVLLPLLRCVEHPVIDYIAGTRRQKHQPLNNSRNRGSYLDRRYRYEAALDVLPTWQK